MRGVLKTCIFGALVPIIPISIALADLGNRLIIKNAQAFFDEKILVINGGGFGPRSPVVLLGGQELEVLSFRESEISANLPNDVEAGSYLLSVSKNSPNSDPNSFDVFYFTIGAVGPTGPLGPTGPQGSQGIQGPRGEIGPQGIPGPVGPQGVTGAVGPSGPQGNQGPIGPQGLKGDKGDKGPQGDPGALGAAGPQGLKGDKGDAGAEGPAGVLGLDLSHHCGCELTDSNTPGGNFSLHTCPAGSYLAGIEQEASCGARDNCIKSLYCCKICTVN